KFHHVEFYCGDATAAASRFVWGLGMKLVAKSDQSTGNAQHASYVVQSNDLRFVCTAPYSLATTPTTERGAGDRPDPSSRVADVGESGVSPLPGFDPAAAHEFFRRHGLAGRVREVARTTHKCYAKSRLPLKVGSLDTCHGTLFLMPLSFLPSHRCLGGGGIMESGRALGPMLYTWVQADTDCQPTLPPSGICSSQERFSCGRVTNVVLVSIRFSLEPIGEYMTSMTGMHEFAEFAAADVGTVDSGLNSIVLASNNEMVLLPLNEPAFGTAKKSQIQNFLEQNDGPGLQHIALKTNDIFRTMRLMRANSGLGGFEFMEPPGAAYYRDVPRRVPSLTEDQLRQLEELGLLADKDEDDGVLLQVFTKPVGDRPTLFFEIIQRIGCAFEATDGDNEGDRGVFGPVDEDGCGGRVSSRVEEGELLQRGGCGGFGLGNFKALFESFEKYESTLATGVDA
ncbi:unnamed protein product, partial [Ectocarpus sp. 8 AP-2014]